MSHFLQSFFHTAVLPVHTEECVCKAFARGQIKEGNSNKILQLCFTNRDYLKTKKTYSAKHKGVNPSRDSMFLQWRFRGFGVRKLAS